MITISIRSSTLLLIGAGSIMGSVVILPILFRLSCDNDQYLTMTKSLAGFGGVVLSGILGGSLKFIKTPCKKPPRIQAPQERDLLPTVQLEQEPSPVPQRLPI